MKYYLSLYIFFLLAFYFCYGQNRSSFAHKPKQLSCKYTTWQWNFDDKKSFVFIPPIESPKNPFKKTPFLFLQNPQFVLKKTVNAKIHTFSISSGQRLNKALTFSGRDFLLQLYNKSISKENRISLFKMVLKTINAPETRIGVYNNPILLNDTRRPSIIISNRLNPHLRPYSVVNQRATLFLLGLNIPL